MTAAPDIASYFDEATNAVTYLVADPASKAAAVIDSVLDFDAASGALGTSAVDRVLADATSRGLRVEWVLETHVHADHLSAAAVIKARTGAKIGIGEGVRDVQSVFGPMFAAGEQSLSGSFDRLFRDGESLQLGGLTVEIMATPGHTPACVSYRVGDAVFVGDTLFMPDYGTARTDFPGGDARQLYRSMQRILSLPRDTRLFLCHDYKAPGRDSFAWETTVGEELERNVHIGGGVSEDEYVAMREARDAKLSAPKLLYPALQVNIRGGRLPPASADGKHHLSIPLSLPEGLAL